MKKLHFHLFATILFGLLSQCLHAQDSETKVKELYLSGNLLTFDNFGLQYKSELNNGNFFRIGMTNIYAMTSKSNEAIPVPVIPSTSSHYAGTFDIGLEKRKQITNKLTCFYGLNFVITTSLDRNKREDPTLSRDLRHLNNFSINPGFGFNSGFIYKISDEFSISAELIPQLLYNYSSRERISGTDKVLDTIQGGSFIFDNRSVLVSLIYKWGKK